MKKATAILLLFVFLFNTVGYVVLYKIMQTQLKQEAADFRSNFKSYIFKNKKESLTQFRIKKSQLHKYTFVDEGKELLHNNEMYDIVHTIEKTDEYIYYCLPDKKEKQLLANLADHVDSNLVDGKNLHKSSSKKISSISLKLYSEQTESLFSILRDISSVSYISFKINYSPALIEVNSPPPELA